MLSRWVSSIDSSDCGAGRSGASRSRAWPWRSCCCSRFPQPAQLSGTVFVDLNRNGVRDAGEPARAGVAVSNGLDVVQTDAEGGYSLAEGPRGFVFVTRPAGFECESWHRRSAGDFALVPIPTENDFFFVQMSDLHVYDRASELIEEFGLGDPWWAALETGRLVHPSQNRRDAGSALQPGSRGRPPTSARTVPGRRRPERHRGLPGLPRRVPARRERDRKRDEARSKEL